MRADAWTRLALAAVLVPLAALGCRQGMYDDVKYEPYEKSELFPNETSARPLPAGTVARGLLGEDRTLVTGLSPEGTFAANPLPITRELLVRGRERFDVFCSPCHDRVGTGDGMIVRRGYTRPPTFHDDRLRRLPDGHLFDVITRGYGQMPSYAAQVPVEDRWAIVAYVRALQLSQDAQFAALPAEVRRAAERALARVPAPSPRAAGEAGLPESGLPTPDTVRDVPPAPVAG
ncbi:MAG TPA: cytochrome c, partial [Thermoanaerobaculia bacterium]|nr:cytochrome c [Thermoanaerobaculia bacterium]